MDHVAQLFSQDASPPPPTTKLSSFSGQSFSGRVQTKSMFQKNLVNTRHNSDPVRNKKRKKKKKKAPPDISSSKIPTLVNYHLGGEVFNVFDYYKPVQIIGEGAYATVIEAIDMRNGVKVAIKKNKNVFVDLKDSKRILRELKLLMRFQQDDVIKLLDVIPPSSTDSFNDIFLVMPRMETTLESVIKSDKVLTDKHICFFIYQIFRGLKYVHSANIVHRDMKPANILINGRNCKIKITDFGLARGVDNDCRNPMTEYVCTRWYRAPEVICSGQTYDEKIDIWSAACITAELFTRKPLIPGASHMDQLKSILETVGKPEDTEWVLDEATRKYINLLPEPPGGPSFHEKMELCNSPLAMDLIRRCLEFNPSLRLNAVDALEHEYLAPLHNTAHEPDCDKNGPVLTHIEEVTSTTEFGLRHLMFDSMTSYHAEVKLKKRRRVAQRRAQKREKGAFNTQLDSVEETHERSQGATSHGGRSQGDILRQGATKLTHSLLLSDDPSSPNLSQEQNQMLLNLFEADCVE